MTAPRDPNRLIHDFILEGSEQLQDQVYDAVRAEIDHKRQRAVFGPWRVPTMNKLVPIGLGAAAVVAVLLVGAQLFGAPTGPGGPTATPEPTATPAPSVAPTAPADGSIPVGTAYILFDDGGVRGTVTIPAPGWAGEGGILVKNESADPPDGAGMIVFTGALNVYGDPCQWSATQPDAPATTVDELVAALSAQALRDATAPVDVNIGGYAGKSITLHVPVDAVYAGEQFSECDQGRFGSWGMPGNDPSPFRYHQGPGQIDELWILDVDGVLTVIDTAYYAGTSVEHVEEIRAIVESATFE